MKNHYRNDAEWMAAFNATMKARESSTPTGVKLQHSKAMPIARTSGGLAHTKPMPIRRTP